MTGTTGSGKTTTLAAMIDHINNTVRRHIVTIEDPIEVLHKDRKAIINQREIGLDTESYASALKYVLRQDPDDILIGEMRDVETVSAALTAAQTGHFVMSTLHTIDATETINRIIDFFPLHQQKQVRIMLAGTLRGIISQRLLPRADGQGRVPAVEVMVMTSRIRDFVLDPDQTSLIGQAIKEGEFYGMTTFDQALAEPLRGGADHAARRRPGAHQPARLQAARAGQGPRRQPDDLLDARSGPASAGRRRALGSRRGRRAAAALTRLTQASGSRGPRALRGTWPLRDPTAGPCASSRCRSTLRLMRCSALSTVLQSHSSRRAIFSYDRPCRYRPQDAALEGREHAGEAVLEARDLFGRDHLVDGVVDRRARQYVGQAAFAVVARVAGGVAERQVAVQRHVLLARGRLDGRDDLPGDAQFGEAAKRRLAVVAVVAHRLVEADHALLDQVFGVAAGEKVRARLEAHELVVTQHEGVEGALVAAAVGVDEGEIGTL